MLLYEIIETDGGLTIVERDADSRAEEVADRRGAALLDYGPFKSYDDAYDAILALQDEEDEEAGI
jgi:hypothetical protein